MKQRKLPPPSKSVGQNTRGAFRALETAVTRTLNGVGMRYSHFQVLHVLWHGDGLTQGEIAEASYITDSSLAQVLNEMVAEGLVERRRDEQDGRKRLVYLSNKGKASEKLVSGQVLKVMNTALEGLSEDEISQYLKTVKKIRRNLYSQFELRQQNGSSKKTA